MFNKSLDSILSTFTKVQSELQTFIERTTIESDALNESARQAQIAANAKLDDVARATIVADKIKALIN